MAILAFEIVSQIYSSFMALHMPITHRYTHIRAYTYILDEYNSLLLINLKKKKVCDNPNGLTKHAQ